MLKLKGPKRASPTNWFQPMTWPAIDHAARITNFSAREMVKELRRGSGGNIFQRLDPGTINKWFAKDEHGNVLRRWKEEVLSRVADLSQRNVRVARLGRPMILV